MESYRKFRTRVCFGLLFNYLATISFAQIESLTLETSSLVENSEVVNDSEVVIQRFPNGKPQIERHVVLDAEGNYVNHGDYQEWNEAGDLVLTGNYKQGLQDGPWIQFRGARDSELFGKEPYNKFKPPFQSSAEFVRGKLHGLWTITDKEGRAVSQIQFNEGRRSGPAIWYHPTGVPLWQIEYRGGVLDGLFVEKDPSGKTLREIRYQAGRKLERKQEFHSNKKVQSEYEQLSPVQILVTPDDWNQNTLATYELSGDALKTGSHTVYYENGAVRSLVHYQDGELEGTLESWYPNGQKEVSGQYKQGLQIGEWNWWHPNGMRKSRAIYRSGETEGEVLAWNDSGKRVNTLSSNEPPISRPTVQSLAQTSAEPTTLVPGTEGSQSRATPKRPGVVSGNATKTSDSSRRKPAR